MLCCQLDTAGARARCGGMKYVLIACTLASPAMAGPMDVHTNARALFDRLPAVEVSDDMDEVCGAGRNSNPHIGFCTSEEQALRGMVTRQVECVAGVLMATAGEQPAMLRGFGQEPFTGSHWGRDPLNQGPRVSIGLEARAEWYEIGYAARDFAACTVGEMSSELIVQALR